MNRRKIGFFRFILEGYDNLAILRTLDAAHGLVALDVPPGRRAEAAVLLDALAEELRLTPAGSPGGAA